MKNIGSFYSVEYFNNLFNLILGKENINKIRADQKQ